MFLYRGHRGLMSPARRPAGETSDLVGRHVAPTSRQLLLQYRAAAADQLPGISARQLRRRRGSHIAALEHGFRSGAPSARRPKGPPTISASAPA